MSDNETTFPEGALTPTNSLHDTLPLPQTLEFVVTVDMSEIHTWFKRCMADFPVRFLNTETGNYVMQPIPDYMLIWFNKWFSQFVEGG